MAKLEKAFLFDGDRFTPEDSATVKGTRIIAYISENDNVCIICDDNDNVLFKINAECAQNFGFLKLS